MVCPESSISVDRTMTCYVLATGLASQTQLDTKPAMSILLRYDDTKQT